MKFLLRKDFNGKNLFGKEVNIECGSYLDSDKNYILYNKLPLVGIRSDMAKKFFVWADDGNEQARLICEDIILFQPREREWTVKIPQYDDSGNITGYENLIVSGRFTPEEVSYIKTSCSHLVLDEPTLIFNDFFYIGSNIEDIQRLAAYINR